MQYNMLEPLLINICKTSGNIKIMQLFKKNFFKNFVFICWFVCQMSSIANVVLVWSQEPGALSGFSQQLGHHLHMPSQGHSGGTGSEMVAARTHSAPILFIVERKLRIYSFLKYKMKLIPIICVLYMSHKTTNMKWSKNKEINKFRDLPILWRFNYVIKSITFKNMYMYFEGEFYREKRQV